VRKRAVRQRAAAVMTTETTENVEEKESE